MTLPLHEHLHCVSTQLLVTDLSRSIQFYTGELGFELNFQHEDFYAGIEAGPYSIHLKLGDSVAPLPADSDHVNLVIGVTNLDACYNTIQSGSAEVIEPLREMPYGREFYIQDPDGYRIAFFDVTS
ncbi:MAG: VOC family protein [Verrucomicrobiota bacterium]